ncbi:hypothetical protein PMAYCL1PPCAC_16793, partial [Pristionchus mayeri]
FQEITRIIHISTTMIAYVLNFMLLYIMRTSPKKDIGPYRILLTFFVISDLYFNTVHFIVYPVSSSFVLNFTLTANPLIFQIQGIALYGGAYGHAFPILIFHFLYRMLAIKHPQLLQHFRIIFSALVAATAASNVLMFAVFYCFFGPDEESLRLLAPVFNGSVHLSLIHTTLHCREARATGLLGGGDVRGSAMEKSHRSGNDVLDDGCRIRHHYFLHCSHKHVSKATKEKRADNAPP